MKIQEFNDVGIKNLNDLTKEELIYCIKGALERDRYLSGLYASITDLISKAILISTLSRK